MTADDQVPCASSPELWFSPRPADVVAAQESCRRCPAQSACLQGALQRQEPWGVWGGEVLEAGRVIPRKPGRGRRRVLSTVG